MASAEGSAKVPTAFEVHLQSMGSVSLGEREYPMAIMTPQFAEDFQNFVGYNRNTETIIISADIPPPLRLLIATTEVLYYLPHNGTRPPTRIDLLRREITEVPDDILAEYVGMRRTFLYDLRKYTRRTAKENWVPGYTPASIRQALSLFPK